jgi:hypothetical protein
MKGDLRSIQTLTPGFVMPRFATVFIYVAMLVVAGCSPPVQNAGDLIIAGSGAPGPQPTQYTLKVSGTLSGGHVTVDERGAVSSCEFSANTSCEQRFLGDEILTLQAFPTSGWRFDRWVGCEVARSDSIVIRMPKENLECEARFFPFADGFDISLVPDKLETTAGIQATGQLTIERGTNFGALPIHFELDSPPPGITLAAPVADVADITAALALDVHPSVSPGQYLLQLKGAANNSGGQDVTRSITLALVVMDSSAYHLGLDTPTLSISRATSCTLTVAAFRNFGFTDDINLESQSLPPGVTAGFGQDPLVGNETEWVISAAGDALFGERDVMVSGTARAQQRLAKLHLAVTAARDSCATGKFNTSSADDFAISINTPSVVLPQGQDVTVDVNIDRSLGYAGDVFFSANGAPQGVLLKFDPPPPAAGGIAHLVVLSVTTATRGSSTIVVTATGGNKIRTATFQLTISPGMANCPLAPSADASISPSWLQGPVTTLQVESNRIDRAAKSYLAFDAAQIPQPFDKVELVLTLVQNNWANFDPGSTRLMKLHGIIDDQDWKPQALAENAITWDNAPKNATQSTHSFIGEGTTAQDPVRVLGTFVVKADDVNGTSYRVDITDYVRWGLGGNKGYSTFAESDPDGLLTILMADNLQYSVAGDNDWTTFYARENSQVCLRPHLEVYR